MLPSSGDHLPQAKKNDIVKNKNVVVVSDPVFTGWNPILTEGPAHNDPGKERMSCTGTKIEGEHLQPCSRSGSTSLAN